MSKNLPWYQRPPDSISLQEAQEILQDPKENRAHFPNQFQHLIQSVAERVDQMKEQSKADNPLAWFQPSYEQTLKLNSWIYGIDYIIDFDANRIGKTAGGVVSALLWILPNEDDWVMFQPYTDHLQKTFQTIKRPTIHAMKGIRENLKKRNLSGDPKKPLEHPANLECYKATLQYIKDNHFTIKPNNPKRTVWVGGPDNEWNAKNIVAEWKKWTPKHVILSQSDYNHEMVIQYNQPLNKVYPKNTTTILFKSYDSKDTKWSGGAVDGIMMSEGIPQQIFNEIRQRYKYPAFASWDYTPYEPRNTASKSKIAHDVYKGKEQVPLNPYIYSGFGIETTPERIMDEEKRADLLRNWKGKPEGEARIHGKFFSSSPIVLKNYDPEIHALSHFSFEDLRKKYLPRPLILFRGLDPGWGHVTSCAWMALAPDNTKYIYKVYSRAERSIQERVEDIITLSGNKRIQHPRNPRLHLEVPSNPANKIHVTWIDYHQFKTDEETKRPYANKYIEHGLIVRPSITYGPLERAQMLNDLLQPQLHLPHPIRKKPPGSKIFFLVDEPGVAEALQKMENIFYQTFEKGEKRGLTKDAVQDYDDDELDAVCYVTCPTLLYQSFVISQNANTNPSSTGSNSRLSFSTGIQFTT